MGSAHTTKNILIIGNTDHGKTTLNMAISKVLNERYGLCELSGLLSPKSGVEEVGKHTVEFDTQNYHYVFIDVPSKNDYIEYLEKHGDEVDCAVLVCAIHVGTTTEVREQIELCERHEIELACAYMSYYDRIDDEEFLEFVAEGVCDDVASIVNKKAAAVFSSNGTCPIIAGNLKDAIENPMGEEGDNILRVLNFVNIAVKEDIV